MYLCWVTFICSPDTLSAFSVQEINLSGSHKHSCTPWLWSGAGNGQPWQKRLEGESSVRVTEQQAGDLTLQRPGSWAIVPYGMMCLFQNFIVLLCLNPSQIFLFQMSCLFPVETLTDTMILLAFLTSKY